MARVESTGRECDLRLKQVNRNRLRDQDLEDNIALPDRT